MRRDTSRWVCVGECVCVASSATVRTLAELESLAPMLRNPSGPILLDCKINGNLPAPFLLEGYGQEVKRG